MADDVVIRYLERRSNKRFTTLMSELHCPVHAIAYGIVKDASLADDVAQEVFSKILDSSWNPAEIASGKGLVRTLTVHTAQDMKRSRDRRELREVEFVLRRESEDDPSASLEERYAAVRKAVRGLPRDVQRCVELHYFEGLKVREVASKLGFQVRRVERNLETGRSLLHTRLTASQRALVLPVLDGLVPVSDPGVSEEHLASLRDTLEQQAREHFEARPDAVELSMQQSAPPASPPHVGKRARRGGKRRADHHGWRRSWMALSASAVVVVAGVALIAWLLTENQRQLGAVEESSTTVGGTDRLGADLLVADVQITPAAFTDGRDALRPGESTPAAGVVAPEEDTKTPDANESQNAAEAFWRNFFGGDRIEVAVVDEGGELLQDGRLMVDLQKPGAQELSTHVKHELAKENPHVFFVDPASIGTRAIARLEVPGYPRTRIDFALIDKGRIDLTLPSAGESVVQLLEASSGRPILAAEVVATISGDPDSLIRGITGRDGRLTLRGLASGAYNDLDVLRSGYPLLKLRDTDFPAERTLRMQRHHPDTCALEVGTPRRGGARVVAMGAGRLVVAETDQRGDAAFEGLRPGFYRFEYYGEGPFPTDPDERAWCATELKVGEHYMESIPKLPREPTVWTFDPPPPGSLSFEIVDHERQPVSGVELLLDGGWRRKEGRRSGTGRIGDLEPVRYTVELVGKTRWMMHNYVRIKSDEEKSETFRYGRRSLRGRLAGGRPGESYQLLLLTTDRSSYAQPGPGGQFEFGGLLPGKYRLFVLREDGSWLPQYRVVFVGTEADPDPLEIPLSRLIPTWVSVRHTAASTNTRMPVVTELFARNARGELRGLEAQPQGTKDLEFFGFLPAGEYQFEARQEEFGFGKVVALVAPGNREPIELPVK